MTKKSDYNTKSPDEKPREIDWDKVIREYNESLDKWIAEGIDTPETRRRQAELGKPVVKKERPSRARPRTGSARDGTNRGQPAKYDRDVMLDLYKSGSTCPEIAVVLGCDVKTVMNGLQALGVYQARKNEKRTNGT